MKRNIILCSFLFALFINLNAQNGIFNAMETSDTIKIDGIADDSVWIKQDWYDLNYVWIPYNGNITPSDFTGKFKVAWDSGQIYLLVEIVDDSLYDGHVNPTDNYWNDDCVEVFVDEDKSGGIHETNFNAFAYHVSTTYDVVDNGATYNSHITTRWTKSGTTYTWELAIKIYDDTYQVGGANVPVELEADKVLGFSLAYCDNDGSSQRENFIGSKYQTAQNANMSYINASVFGTLTLLDTANVEDPDTTENTDKISVTIKGKENTYSVYPTFCHNHLLIMDNSVNQRSAVTINVCDLKGALYSSKKLTLNDEEPVNISTQDLPAGIYNLIIQSDDETVHTRFIKIN